MSKSIETMDMPKPKTEYPRTEGDVQAEHATENAWELPKGNGEATIDAPKVIAVEAVDQGAQTVPVDHQLPPVAQA